MNGEGIYNLNSIKEIGATESYLSLDQDVRGCQTKEPLHVCTTRLYIDTLLDQCKCIPFNIKESDKEIKIVFYLGFDYSIYRSLFAHQPNLTVSTK